MKRGDIVRITKGEPPFFHAGDLARLTHKSISGYWWGDFNKLGNAHVLADGRWNITEVGECEVVKEA